MVKRVACHLLLLFIFAIIISIASTSRILKESIDETSGYGLPTQDSTEIGVDDGELSIARRMDLVLDYTPVRKRPPSTKT